MDFKKFDSVICLSKKHKKYLSKSQKSIYMPGGIKPNSFKNVKVPKINKRIIELLKK